MGIQKIIAGAEKCKKYLKLFEDTKSILQTARQDLSKVDTCGLTYTRKLEGDVVELGKSANKAAKVTKPQVACSEAFKPEPTTTKWIQVSKGIKSLKNKLLTYLGDKIYSTTGIMTNNTLVRNAKRIGSEIVIRQKKQGKVSIDDVISVTENVLGKKQASKIGIVKTKEEFVAALQKNLGIPQEVGARYYEQCLSASLPKGNGDKAFLNLRINDLPDKKIGNITAHETEHSMYQTFSIDAKRSEILTKINLGKSIQANTLSKAQLLNDKLFATQKILIRTAGGNGYGLTNNPKTLNGLLNYMGCKNIEELHSKIRNILFKNNIIEIGKDEQNVFIASAIRTTLKDEARAYDVGGITERLYNELMLGESSQNASRSEMCSLLYKEAVKVLRQEKKFSLKHYIAKRIGFTPKYKRENNIMDLIKQEKEREIQEMKKHTVVLKRDDVPEELKKYLKKQDK